MSISVASASDTAAGDAPSYRSGSAGWKSVPSLPRHSVDTCTPAAPPVHPWPLGGAAETANTPRADPVARHRATTRSARSSRH